MIIKSTAETNVGKVRDNNEDNFFLCGRYKNDPNKDSFGASDCKRDAACLFAVCDGMGGIQLGEIASLTAVKTLAKYADDFDLHLDEYIADANRLVCDEAHSRNLRRIGTTLAALSICGETALAYNIGDSRVYLFRDGLLTQLSEDHTQVQALLKYGVITEDEALQHPGKHVLTQHIGIPPGELQIEPYAAEPIALKSGDVFLLCSDGLTDMLTDDEIHGILSGGGDLDSRKERLIERALGNGGRDNVTVVLVTAVDEPEFPRESEMRALLLGSMSPGNRESMSGLIEDIILKAKVRDI